MTTVEQAPPPVSTRVPSRAFQITRAVLNLLFERRGPRAFAIRLWDGSVLPAAGGQEPRFTLVLTHPGALRRMLLPPGELTMAEAYVRGDFDLEGDLVAAMLLASTIGSLTARDWLRLARHVMALPVSNPPQPFEIGGQPVRLRGRLHSPERDRAAVTYHYDAGNDFYALFLGKSMAYTCAYYPAPETDLDAAQFAKFDHVCRKLRLRPGERLLDIGCGWGGLVLYAAQHYGVEAVGITLSRPQAEFGQERIRRAGLADRARIEVCDYREFTTDRPLDKIASVGMVEHVGHANLRAFIGGAFRALRPGGLFLLHGITNQPVAPGEKMQDWIQRKFFQRGQFVQRYVFPDAGSGPIEEILAAAGQSGFEVCDVENLRPHYALTARAWIRNLEAHQAEAVQLGGERAYRVWRLYLAGGVRNLETGVSSLFQSLLSRSGCGLAAVPLTRADLYR